MAVQVATKGNAIPSSLVFTAQAAAKVCALIREEGNPSLKLRVFITGGGCSGFQYGFTFDEKKGDDDMVVETQVSREQVAPYLYSDEEDDEGGGTVQLLVDPMSYQYLMGAEIDYREDVNGAQFVIRNPNAKTTCGCGASFSA